MNLGLTFDDVLLVPKRTPLSSRSEADLRTVFTKNIALNIPLVSANMATVTEHKMAIAMAREGGLGIIHQFGLLEDQAAEVRRVKRSTSYIIEDPLSVAASISIRDAVEVMRAENVTSLLIMEGDQLAGIFTSRDYLFEENRERPVKDVMTPRNRMVVAEPGISLDGAKMLLHKHRIEKLPLLKDGKVVGLITTLDIKKLEYWPNASRDSKGRLLVGAAVGVKDTIERAQALIDAGADVLVLDVAHAHSDRVIAALKMLKAKTNVDVMVGNIATGDAARELIEAGADGVKVGIGPSPVCTTRIISGAGAPQLTAILEVARVAKKYGIPVCADGGMKYPGDVVKALAAGASTAFSGAFFAGTDEAPGFIIMKDGKRYKRYAGSASYESNHERRERLEGREHKEKLDLFVEGVSVLVDYKGSVKGVLDSLIKGVRSGMSYCGSKTIRDMHERAEFMQITSASFDESKARGMKLSE